MDNQPIVKNKDLDLSFIDAIEGKKTIKIIVNGKLAVITGVTMGYHYFSAIENQTEICIHCTVDEDL